MLTATPDGGLQSTERNGYGKSRWLCVQFVAVVLKECLDIVSDLCVELGVGLDDLCESLWWVGLGWPSPAGSLLTSPPVRSRALCAQPTVRNLHFKPSLLGLGASHSPHPRRMKRGSHTAPY